MGGDYYLGGYPTSEAPFYGMAGTANFSGCLKDVFLGQDTADLGSFSESANIKTGCTLEVGNGSLRPQLSLPAKMQIAREDIISIGFGLGPHTKMISMSPYLETMFYPLQSEYLVTFPAASPGFVQLQTEELTGSLEVTLMFRTGQRRGMLAYLQDADRFFYVSLALVDGGALELRVFPQVNL